MNDVKNKSKRARMYVNLVMDEFYLSAKHLKKGDITLKAFATVLTQVS
jgi:hypothetical protein